MPESAVAEAPATNAGIPQPQQFTAIDPADDPFTQFDTPKEPAAKPAAEKPQTVHLPTKPVEQAPEKPEKAAAKEPDKTPEKATEPLKDEKAEVPPEKMAPKALREAYDKLKREMKEREAKYTTELETVRKSTAPKDDPEKFELSKKYQELEARHKALDDEMRYIDFEKSSEFKTKYHEPYVNSWNDAVAALADYRVVNEDGKERPATVEDLTKVAQAGSMPEARRIAKSLFGEEDAHDIVGLRNKIVEANRAMQNAKAEFRKNGTERMAQMERQQKQQAEQTSAEWKKLNADAIEKYPQWFKADEADTKGAELLAKGFELSDLAFSGNLPPDKAVALHSAIRNQAAGFRYMVHKWESAKEQIADLEKKLDGYKASTPGKGTEPDTTKPKDELADPFAKFE